MRRSDWVIRGFVVIILTALLSWLARTPQSPMMAVLGLPGPAAATGRRCVASYRHTRWGSIPTRNVACRGPRDPERPQDEQQVGYDQLTRRISSVHVMMTAPDSATWSFRNDSIARAITQWGGRAILCAPHHPSLTHIKAKRIWRFDGFDVRLAAYRFADHDPRLAEWLLQVDAFAPRARACGVVATPA
jgi:hypothetical protein